MVNLDFQAFQSLECICWEALCPEKDLKVAKIERMFHDPGTQRVTVKRDCVFAEASD
jgi:hypothetical protein